MNIILNSRDQGINWRLWKIKVTLREQTVFVFHGFIYQASVTRMHCDEMIMIIRLTPYRGV
jgi:hypothetical protein